MTGNSVSKTTGEGALEALFAQARAHPPAVPEALMARVVADAAALQPARPLWARLFEAIGGAAGIGGLVTATCVGVWLGVSPPEAMPDLAGQVLGFETEDDATYDAVGVTGFGWDLGES